MSLEPEDNSDLELHQGEREALEARANLMGISFHPSLSTEKLRERVNAKLASTVDEANETSDEKKRRIRANKKKEASKLIRCRIHCQDPGKKEWPGEIITVGNSFVGTFRKYVPYNQDEPYHLPQIILDVLREKRVQVFKTKKGKNGINTREAKSIAAYAIEILPQLTADELAALAAAQQARNSIE